MKPTTKEIMQPREWLIGWFEGAYSVSFTQEGYKRHMRNIKRRSRESLWELRKKVMAVKA